MRKINPETVEERRGLILSTAYALIGENGVQSVTMDRLVPLLPFSKGTLYSHFSSREDVLMALICERTEKCDRLFQQASTYQGPTRSRFLAMVVAAEIDQETNPVGSTLLVNQSILEKASPFYRERFEDLHNRIVHLFYRIVEEGQVNGDLSPRIDPEDLANAVWALFQGSTELRERGLIYRQADRADFYRRQRRMLNTLLDGYGWKPLAGSKPTESLMEEIRQKIFTPDPKVGESGS